MPTRLNQPNSRRGLTEDHKRRLSELESREFLGVYNIGELRCIAHFAVEEVDRERVEKTLKRGEDQDRRRLTNDVDEIIRKAIEEVSK